MTRACLWRFPIGTFTFLISVPGSPGILSQLPGPMQLCGRRVCKQITVFVQLIGGCTREERLQKPRYSVPFTLGRVGKLLRGQHIGALKGKADTWGGGKAWARDGRGMPSVDGAGSVTGCGCGGYSSQEIRQGGRIRLRFRRAPGSQRRLLIWTQCIHPAANCSKT